MCQSLNPDGAHSEAVLSDAQGHLANVFVHVLDGPESTPPESLDAVVLEERDCRFLPRVAGVRVGQALRIVNRDPTVHDLSVDADVNPSWSRTQPFAGMEVERTLERAEVMISVRCAIHSWMQAWVGVLPHPYFAISDDSGEFSIGGLPAGRYRLEAWHERLGRRRIDVAISPGEEREVQIVFDPKESHVP